MSDETKSTVTQIVEGKLYAWCEYRRLTVPPAPAPVSSWYRRRVMVSKVPEVRVLSLPGRGRSDSPQERAVIRRADIIRLDTIILSTFRRLTWQDKAVFLLRYAGGYRWLDVAKHLGRSRRTVHRAKERIIRLFAAALGLDP